MNCPVSIVRLENLTSASATANAAMDKTMKRMARVLPKRGLRGGGRLFYQGKSGREMTRLTVDVRAL